MTPARHNVPRLGPTTGSTRARTGHRQEARALGTNVVCLGWGRVMERLLARGLQIMTEFEASCVGSGPVRAHFLSCARDTDGARPREEAGCCSTEGAWLPPAPCSQALLDSDLLNMLLTSTVERGLSPCDGLPHPAVFGALAASQEHAQINESQASAQDADDAVERRNTHCESLEDEDLRRSSDSDCGGFVSCPENSPTSTAWSDWDGENSLSRKRKRELLPSREGDEQRWSFGHRCAY